MGGIVAGMLALALLEQPQAPTSAESGDEFARLETVWNQAHLQGDADTLDHLWADDVVVIVPRMPPFTKSEALSVFLSGRMKFPRYVTSDITVRRYESCVVVTGRLQRSRTLGERVVEDDWRFTKVYVRGPKAWRVVTFHASEAGQ
jgi:hypothetical protein